LFWSVFVFADDRNPWHVHDESKKLANAKGIRLPDDVLKYRYGVPEDNTPVQFHLAFAGANGMMIAWQTDTNTATHVCKYGTTTAITQTATGFSRTYGAGYTHFVTLSNLNTNTKYYYSCGDSTAGFGPVTAFMSQPAVGSRSSFAIAVIGDMGIPPNSQGTATSAISHLSSFDWTLHIGDLGYADDAYLYGGTYEQTYTTFMNQIAPISSVQAYMGLPGNHEDTCNEALPGQCPSDEKKILQHIEHDGSLIMLLVEEHKICGIVLIMVWLILFKLIQKLIFLVLLKVLVHI